MIKSKTNFTCQNCNTTYTKWIGKCEDCGEWNTLVEQIIDSGKSAVARGSSTGKILDAKNLKQISANEDVKRYQTGFGDLDDMLGGGIVSGGIVLLAGQPGIGKSTLLLQIRIVNQFNAELKSLESRINALDSFKQKIEANHDLYEAKAKEFNSLVVTGNSLTTNLDSTLEPVVECRLFTTSCESN